MCARDCVRLGYLQVPITQTYYHQIDLQSTDSGWTTQSRYVYILVECYALMEMHFGPETACALRANVTRLASSARHQCVAFN